MTKKQKATEWFQRIILRGIEGVIGDEYLKIISLGNDVSVLDDYYETKYMATQIYAQLCGWGL
jgi:hypothetical protein